MSNLNTKTTAYMDAVAKTLPAKVQTNLKNVTAGNKRLLAIRNYIHFSIRIKTRWAMTASEETLFKASQEYKDMADEVKKIKAKFAKANKGHKLSAQTDARSLGTQTKYWNGNKTVEGLGKALRTKLKTKLKGMPETPTEEGITELSGWLNTVKLKAVIVVGKGKDGKPKTKAYKSATHATPGLSSHGRIRAIDFKVKKGGSVVAGTTTATAKSVWDTPGWTKKLETAITAVSTNWDGPLANPYEPWHWTFTKDNT